MGGVRPSVRKVGRPKGSLMLRGSASKIVFVSDRQWLLYVDTIAKRLVNARLERGLSVKDLALASGIDVSGICRIEGRRHRDILLSTICRCALAMKMNPSELMP